jgi:hypothetical protein
MRRCLLCLLICLAAAPAAEIQLPNKPRAVRFAVIGDNGTGAEPEYQVAEQMTRSHEAFPFDFVIMLGDNIYGSAGASGFKKKFEDPYRALLDAGVKFYAALGNHDNPNERLYKPFNMGEKRYYSFQKGNAELFALDSNYMDPEQLNWLTKQLMVSRATWKICYFHHPLYSHGRDHGPDSDLRKVLEPIFERDGVQAVFSGHEHDYERVRPQHGIAYFVLGNSGQLRQHNVKPSPDTIKSFDTDRSFGLVEISGDELFFQIISRTGETVDSGMIEAKREAVTPRR